MANSLVAVVCSMCGVLAGDSDPNKHIVGIVRESGAVRFCQDHEDQCSGHRPHIGQMMSADLETLVTVALTS